MTDSFSCLLLQNYLFVSRFTIPKVCFIELRRLVFFYFIDILKYKKSEILFFIFSCLLSGGILKVNKSIYDNFNFYTFTFLGKSMFIYLRNFITIYLPLLFVDNRLQNVNITTSLKTCVINYRNSPAIPELDFLSILCPNIWDIIWSFRFQLIFYFNVSNLGFSEFFLRFARLPIKFSFTEISN